MVIYGLLRLQNAEVDLIPSHKFEFWCDHGHLKKVRALKILLCFRALSDLPRFYKDILVGIRIRCNTRT